MLESKEYQFTKEQAQLNQEHLYISCTVRYIKNTFLFVLGLRADISNTFLQQFLEH